MTVQSLWGDLGEIETRRTPTVILREQAELLAQLTNDVLKGEVVRTPFSTSERFLVSLMVVVPALQNYRLEVLSAFYHYLSIYPVKVHDSINDNEEVASDEEGLVEIVRKILTSEKVLRAIATLISEARMSSES